MTVYPLATGSASYIPNSYQKPNFIVDKLAWLLTPDEYMVLDFIVRHILGWQQRVSSRQARLSITKFTDGFEWTDKNGQVVKLHGLNLGRSKIMDCLKNLVDFGIVLCLSDESEKFHPDGTLYGLPDDGEINIRFDLLMERREANLKKQQHRTLKARIKAHESRLGVVCHTDEYPSVAQTPTSLCDRHNETHIKPSKTQDSSAPADQAEPEKNSEVPAPAEASVDVTAVQESLAEEKKKRPPAKKEKPSAPADYEARPWLYGAAPVPDEQFATLNKTDQRTAIFAVICWKGYQTVASAADVYKKLTAKKGGGKLGLEHRLNSLLTNVEGLTPSIAADVFDTYHGSNKFSKEARDPAIFLNEIEKRMVKDKPKVVPTDPAQWTVDLHPEAAVVRQHPQWKWAHAAYALIQNTPDDKLWRVLTLKREVIWNNVLNAYESHHSAVTPYKAQIESHLAKLNG